MANDRVVWPDGKIVSPAKNRPSSDPRPGLSLPKAPFDTLVMIPAQRYDSKAVAAVDTRRASPVRRPMR